MCCFGFPLQLFFSLWMGEYVSCDLCECVCVCGNMVWNKLVIIFSKNFCVYLYICMYVCVHLCTSMINVLLNFGLNLSINYFYFISSTILLLVWYMGIILEIPWLHSYKCLDIFNFLSSDILIWLLWKLQSWVSSSLIEYPINKAFCHIWSLTK